MALKDYKDLKCKLTRDGLFVVEKTDIVDIFKSYLKRLSKGDVDLKLLVGVNVKRRQNLLSYKKQVIKGLNANKVQLKIYAQKLGLTLEDDFVTIISNRLNNCTDTDNKYNVEGCTDSFVLVCSEVNITKD